MKMMHKGFVQRHCTHLYLVIFFLVLSSGLLAQTGDLREYIASSNHLSWKKLGIEDTTGIKEFYRARDYKPAWTGEQNRPNHDFLLTLLADAASEGLNEADYQYHFIRTYKDSSARFQSSENWMITEIRLTDAALHYFGDIAFGNPAPVLYHDGLSYQPGCISIPWQLSKHLEYNSLEKLTGVLQPPMPEIQPIRVAIFKLQRVMADTAFREEKVVSNKAALSNKPLIRKLHHLGIIDSADKMLTDALVMLKVKEAQRLFGLLDDGVIRGTLLNELNIPLSSRLRQLFLSLNYYRWVYCLSRQQPVVVVNIPAAYLKVYQEGKIILEMKTIVGKSSTPTPTLSSRITEVVLYPYWHVPNSIATKELLPSIKRDPGYIDANSYQVLNSQGKIMDPAKINWSALGPGNFPYTIRQSTGCDNALGLLKLNFYNPFSVYLHDTPTKSLFKLSKRFFSHGCMRMENPMEMGYLVLNNNTIAIDTLEQKGCLRNQAPVIVPADPQLPVVVWYNPAGTDATGRLVYYEDIYKRFPYLHTK
jgi:L,D-transpeptidase YcbB